MTKEKLIIATSHPLKFKELATKLGEFFICEQGIFENYKEIQGKVDEIILHKLYSAYEYFKAPVLVDDTSLHLDELGGFPGPYIKDFIAHVPTYEMGVKFAGTRVQVACRLGFYNGKDDPIIAIGEVHGDVVTPKNVDPGPLEFDLFVQLDGMDRPMIEYSTEEKNEFSHRGLALKDLIFKLEK